MSYVKDLEPCNYFGRAEGHLLAIGWLARNHDYRKGSVARPFFETLAKSIAEAWQPFASAGRHSCEFCVFTGGPAELGIGGVRVALGASNVFIPGEGVVYVAPSLIVHYIDAHEYVPREEFQRAVEQCPPMRSMPYLKALREHGVHRLGKTNED